MIITEQPGLEGYDTGNNSGPFRNITLASLEVLTCLDTVIVQQRVGVFETILNFETKNRYSIQTEDGRKVCSIVLIRFFYLSYVPRVSVLERGAEKWEITAFSSVREIELLHENVLQKAPWIFNAPCQQLSTGGKRIRQGHIEKLECIGGQIEARFFTTVGFVGKFGFKHNIKNFKIMRYTPFQIGCIKQYCGFRLNFNVYDGEGKRFAYITGPPYCGCGCCTCHFREKVFKVYSSIDNSRIGAIKKVWGGVLKEFFTDADSFRVE
ncbi:unnamed protein product [Angiostrongylus costaricensis]|uniref:Phospholipid scramblase n=1 Tax=Angiostrongylus costaricensis TaxID=334426 RepID=A0A0R3PBG8_ANGCS|nr:unnamed protein product [Angiostrongylus costaricensis]